MKFDIFLKIHVPGSTEIGQKLGLMFFLKIHVRKRKKDSLECDHKPDHKPIHKLDISALIILSHIWRVKIFRNVMASFPYW